MSEPLYLLLLGPYHVDDPLFVRALARALARASVGGGRMMAVHGSGERAERLLEGEGGTVERQEGVLVVEDLTQAMLVERGVRETNRGVVGTLTESMVHAVGVHGLDRGLVQESPAGELQVGNVRWIEALLARGVVPVVSALVGTPAGPAREVRGARVASLLAARLGLDGGAVVAFTRTNRTGVLDEGAPRPTVRLDALPEELVSSDRTEIALLLEAGLPVVLTSPGGLGDGAGVLGTRIVL